MPLIILLSPILLPVAFIWTWWIIIWWYRGDITNPTDKRHFNPKEYEN